MIRARRSSSRRAAALASLAALTFLLAGAEARADDFYVAPDGSASGDGSMDAPWDLRTALAHPSEVSPGDTIWLRGGTYTPGPFTSELTGTDEAPIVVRQMPGERATIDGGDSGGASVLTIEGGYTWFWGFELMSSSGVRRTGDTGSSPDVPQGEGINVGNGSDPVPGIRLINLVVHDTRQGLSLWQGAVDLEAYGNLIYHNGWDGPDRGHGHAIYTQNQTGTKHIEDNIAFGGFAYGFHAYGSASAYDDHYRLVGNTFFAAGTLSAVEGGSELLMGGGRPITDDTIESNYVWGDARIGYSFVEGVNHDAVVRGNYFAGNTMVVRFESLVFRDNVLIAPDSLLTLYDDMLPALPEYDWDGNEYHCTSEMWGAFAIVNDAGGTAYSWEDWRSFTGFDATGELSTTNPADPAVFVRPNRYEPGRGNITVFNWGDAATVAVDLSSVLSSGDAYEVRDAEDFFGAPVATGTWDGTPIALPMDGTSAAQPVGTDVPRAYEHSPIRFGAFIVLRTSAAPPVGDGGAPDLDGGAPTRDASSPRDGDVARNDAGSGGAPVDGGCGCSAPGRVPGERGMPVAFVLSLGLLGARRRAGRLPGE